MVQLSQPISVVIVELRQWRMCIVYYWHKIGDEIGNVTESSIIVKQWSKSNCQSQHDLSSRQLLKVEI